MPKRRMVLWRLGSSISRFKDWIWLIGVRQIDGSRPAVRSYHYPYDAFTAKPSLLLSTRVLMILWFHDLSITNKLNYYLLLVPYTYIYMYNQHNQTQPNTPPPPQTAHKHHPAQVHAGRRKHHTILVVCTEAALGTTYTLTNTYLLHLHTRTTAVNIWSQSQPTSQLI